MGFSTCALFCILLSLAAQLEAAGGKVSPQTLVGGDECSALQCVASLPGIVAKCVIQIGNEGPIAILKCINEVLGDQSKCKPCVCVFMDLAGIPCPNTESGARRADDLAAVRRPGEAPPRVDMPVPTERGREVSQERPGPASAQLSTRPIAQTGEIREGSSISSVARSFERLNFNVKFKLEIENYSDQHLTPYQWKIHTGLVSSPHVPVKPGLKEAMSGHKTGHTATGCVGTVSWKIGDTNKMLVVMYSVPYDHNLHSNWLGVGIFDLADTSNHYNIMLYENEMFFKRKEFYYNVDPVVYQDANYLVIANMGTTHKPIIQVQLFPQKIKHHEL